jgi:ABC-type multidrug transport system ATPase subunit
MSLRENDTTAPMLLEEPAEQPAEQSAEQAADTAVIHGRGLEAGTGARRVFGGLDLDVPAGGLAVVHGPRGSGRSLLLLALTGRGSGVRGSLQVAGLDAAVDAKQLRMITSVARIGTVVDLEPRHTIADAIAERAAVEGLRRAAAADAYAGLAELLELEAATTGLIEDLTGYQQTVLAVALAALRPTELIVLDDAERDLRLADQRRLYAALGRLTAATGMTVVASTIESETIPDTAVEVLLPPAGIPAQHDR